MALPKSMGAVSLIGLGMGAKIELPDVVFFLERERRLRKSSIAYKSILRFHNRFNSDSSM